MTPDSPALQVEDHRYRSIKEPESLLRVISGSFLSCYIYCSVIYTIVLSILLCYLYCPIIITSIDLPFYSLRGKVYIRNPVPCLLLLVLHRELGSLSSGEYDIPAFRKRQRGCIRYQR
jgi:hypothetical protein